MDTQNRRVGDLPLRSFAARLRAGGIGVRIGLLDVHMTARVRGLNVPLLQMYRDYPLLEGDRVYSCHVGLHETRSLLPQRLRRVRFTVDGVAPHEDMPVEQALAVFEWGMNLVVALRYHCFLMLHAAVVERGGRALLMPAAPGHGKTTLCAALVHRGWRLLSDEFGLVRPGTQQFLPLPRPMPLKNESIRVMQAFDPSLELGPSIPNTRKGTVAHARVPESCVRRARDPAPARWIVFPRWVSGAPLSLEELPRAEGFMLMATNAFNFETLGRCAFETVRELVNAARCYQLVYSDLNEAVTALNRLADHDAP